tara:strand:+ start:954 stop:1529 length:576 start_codon:yes stop_codon:yes gene_type:complete
MDMNTNTQIQKSLKICRCVAKILKEIFPNDIMKLEKNTIIEHCKKNRRLHGSSSMSGIAHYNRQTHRVVIKQSFLINQIGWDGTNYYSLNPIMQKRTKRMVYLKKNGWPEDKIIEKEQTIRKRFFDEKSSSWFYGPRYDGNIALIEMICHELAHHRTSGHGKGFKIKYLRLRQAMTNQIISGEFYRRLENS